MEGVGNAGCPLHPRPRVHLVLVKSTRVYEYTGITRHSRTQWFYGLCRALPGDRAFCHRRLTDMFLSKPGWADATPQDLTPASGRQDHTILPYAATSLVRSPVTAHKSLRTRPATPSRARRCRVHRTPSRVRDDRDTPLCVGRDGRICRDDLPDGESEIFFGKPEIRLDTPVNKPVNKPPDGQITTRPREQIPLVSRTRCSAVCAAPQSRDPRRA